MSNSVTFQAPFKFQHIKDGSGLLDTLLRMKATGAGPNTLTRYVRSMVRDDAGKRISHESAVSMLIEEGFSLPAPPPWQEKFLLQNKWAKYFKRTSLPKPPGFENRLPSVTNQSNQPVVGLPWPPEIQESSSEHYGLR